MSAKSKSSSVVARLLKNPNTSSNQINSSTADETNQSLVINKENGGGCCETIEQNDYDFTPTLPDNLLSTIVSELQNIFISTQTVNTILNSGLTNGSLILYSDSSGDFARPSQMIETNTELNLNKLNLNMNNNLFVNSPDINAIYDHLNELNLRMSRVEKYLSIFSTTYQIIDDKGRNIIFDTGHCICDS